MDMVFFACEYKHFLIYPKHGIINYHQNMENTQYFLANEKPITAIKTWKT